MIRLLAFDLDGTAIVRHRALSPGNRAALEAARQRGVRLLPASGRMLRFFPEDVLALPGLEYLITSNGAAVYRLPGEEAVYRRLIPNKTARAVQRVLDDYDLYLEYYRNGGAITGRGYPEHAVERFHFPAYKLHFTEKDYQLVEEFAPYLAESGLCPEKINLPFVPEDLRDELWQRLSAIEGLKLTSSIPDNIEINAAAANKGDALLWVAGQLGVSPEETMAIGDNGNDVPMLQAAGCSVCVGDGSAEAKAAARYVTAPHEEDGLARAVEQYILNA